MPTPILPQAPSRSEFMRGMSPRFLQTVFRAWVSEFYQVWGRPIRDLPEGAPAAAVAKHAASVADRRAYQEANLVAAGETAAATLEQSAAFIGFLMEYMPEQDLPGYACKPELQRILAHKPELEIHEDGTVTLAPLPGE